MAKDKAEMKADSILIPNQGVMTIDKKKKKAALTWYVFLLPSFIGILLFMVYPIVESFRLSFYQSNGTIENFIGFSNFQLVLTSKTFWNSVWNTFFIAFFQIALTIPLGFIFASMINSVRRGGQNFF